MRRPVYSVVIPAYNESKRLPETLPVFIDFLEKLNIPSEIILVDDGSTDGTIEVANRIYVEFAPNNVRWNPIEVKPNKGKGNAVKEGMLKAEGHYIIFSDADLSTPITEIPKFFNSLKNSECEVAIGSRYMKESNITHDRGLLRRIMSKVFRKIAQFVTGLPVSDTQCGMKAFSHFAAKNIFSNIHTAGFAFDVEVLMLAQKLNFRIKEIPVEWNHKFDSKVSVLRDPLAMFIETVEIRKKYRKAA